MSADKEYTAREHVGPLIENLMETFDLALPDTEEERAKLKKSLLAHIARVGPSNFGDLSSWVTLECLESDRRGIRVDWKEVLRAASRIQHRINRQRARERTFPNTEIAAKAGAMNPSWTIDLKSLLKKLSQMDLIIFHSFYLDGKKAADIGRELGISPAQVYRRLSDLRAMIVELLK